MAHSLYVDSAAVVADLAICEASVTGQDVSPPGEQAELVSASDNAGAFDDANHWYLVPYSGLYFFRAQLAFTESITVGDVYGVQIQNETGGSTTDLESVSAGVLADGNQTALACGVAVLAAGDKIKVSVVHSYSEARLAIVNFKIQQLSNQ